MLTAIGCVPGAGDVIKSIGKAIIKGADDITITLLKKLDAEDTYTAFVKFRQTLQASTEEAVATINVWLKKAENQYKETELAELLSIANECMNKAVDFVHAKVDEFGWKVFGNVEVFVNDFSIGKVALSMPSYNSVWDASRKIVGSASFVLHFSDIRDLFAKLILGVQLEQGGMWSEYIYKEEILQL